MLDELPALTCTDGLVSHALIAPSMGRFRRHRAGWADTVRLRTRMVSLASPSLCSRGAGQRILQEDTLAILHGDLGNDEAAVRELHTAGARVISPLGRRFRVVLLPAGSDLDGLCETAGPVTLLELEPADRLSSRRARHPQQRPVDTTVYRVQYDEPTDTVRVLRQYVGAVTRSEALTHAGEPNVLWVDESEPGPLPLTHEARRTVRTDEVHGINLSVDPPSYSGPTGVGVVAAVVDTGVDADHPDLHRYGPTGEDLGTRVVGAPPLADSAHGTSVAGIMAGNGWASDGVHLRDTEGTPYLWRGHAPELTTVVSIHSSAAPWNLAFGTYNAHLSNHSYVHSPGDYTMDVALFDRVVQQGVLFEEEQRPPRVTIFAAANNGLGPYPDTSFGTLDLQGYYSILAPGKNPICVGGSFANDGLHADGASKGPTLDGRLKPDVIAPGWKYYRPPDGVGLELDEIRLHAANGSGIPDRVWTFDTSGSTDGWDVGWALEALTVAGGTLSATTSSGGADQDAEGLIFDFLAEDGSALDTTRYDRLSITTRLQVGGHPDNHRWPWFWVASWDGAEDGFDHHMYPGYDAAVRDDQWHTHTVTLTDSGGWADAVQRLRIWPTPYDDRLYCPTLGGGYTGSSGTSLAAPVVAGIVALMMQTLAEEHGVDLDNAPPLPSTFKALLIHTANDRVHDTPAKRDPPNPDTSTAVLHYEGPDFATGYGLVDAVRVMQLIDAHGTTGTKWLEQTLNDGETHTYTIPVRHGLQAGPLKVTLAWDDVHGNPLLAPTAPQLVNDLDLIVVAPDGRAHSPWVLDPLPIDEENLWDGFEPIAPEDVVGARRCQLDSYWQGSDTADCEDHRNNVEQVIVDAPAEGWFLLIIRAHDVPEGPQRYSLVVSQQCGP